MAKASIKEEFTKINDYMLEVEQTKAVMINDFVSRYTSYKRTFNFLSCQIKTDQLETVYVSGDKRAAEQQSATSIIGFDELPSLAEVQFMHAKLVELEGKPPALEEVMPLNKKITPPNFDQIKKVPGNG